MNTYMADIEYDESGDNLGAVVKVTNQGCYPEDSFVTFEADSQKDALLKAVSLREINGVKIVGEPMQIRGISEMKKSLAGLVHFVRTTWCPQCNRYTCQEGTKVDPGCPVVQAEKLLR